MTWAVDVLNVRLIVVLLNWIDADVEEDGSQDGCSMIFFNTKKKQSSFGLASKQSVLHPTPITS